MVQDNSSKTIFAKIMYVLAKRVKKFETTEKVDKDYCKGRQ